MIKNFNLFAKFAVVFIVFTALSNDLWAGSSNYARGYAKVSSSSPSNKGKVYVNCTSEGGTQPATPASNNSGWKTSTSKTSEDAANTTFDFYFYSLATSGYVLEGWSETDGASDYSNAAVAKYSIKTSSSTLNDAYTDVTLYAHFVANPTVTVTFLVPDSKCSYTAKCDGTMVAAGSSKTTNKPFNLTVTVNDANYKLLGWYTTTDGGATKSYFSPNTSYINKYFQQTCSVGVDLVEASKPVFMVGDKLFTDLNAANSAASSGSNKTIVLVSDGLLDAGNYTISSGNTLLIPHTIGSTFVNSKSVITEPYIVRTAAALSAFRKLTLQDGVNITVNGKLCVAGKMMSSGGGKASAYPTGECGMIDMSRGGHIELNNGAILYTWGFIKGQDMDQGNNTAGVGTITANSGAVIWEGFATGDWRGGSASSTIYSNADSWKFFPFQSYTIQNIEVPVTYNYGSTLSNFMSIFGDGQIYNGTFDLVGSTNTLFLLKDGNSKLKKWYDPTTDLVCYEMSGTTQLDALNVDAAGETVSSKDYNLPVSTSMHIILASSTTISKPVEIQAGAVVEVKNGATLTCSSNIYLFDKDNWGEYCYKKYYYTMTNLTSHKDRGNGTSNEMIDDAKFIVDGTLNVTGKIYTTAGGADIMGNGGGSVKFAALGNSGNLVMCTGTADNENVAINQANLHNEDGSYTKSIASKTFYNVNGRWFVSGKQNEKSDHTYDFTYISDDQPVSGTTGATTPTDAVYSNDKTGLELQMKWINVTEGECADWWEGVKDGYYYNWTSESAWHQFMPTTTAGMYSGSNNKIYTKTDCTWEELGETDVNCLYTIGGVKKALVDGRFLELTPNNNDPAYHLTSDASRYFICFGGCNWHEATKIEDAFKAYTVSENDYIWYNGEWMQAERELPFFFTYNNTNVKIYYEFLDGEWIIAQPYVKVQNAIETRSLLSFHEAMTVASTMKNATVTILRDIPNATTSGTYTAANTTCTLDLNGHTVAGTATKLLDINASGTTFTITDNSAQKKGKISMSGASNARLYTVVVTDGTLVLNNGTIFGENTLAYNSSSAKTTAVSAVYVAAGKTFNMNGGTVHAEGCSAARGLDIAGSTAANATVNINGGTITAETTQVTTAYGIYAIGGTVNVKPGVTINATAKTTTAYGIYIDASTKKYAGTLVMTGGTVNVVSHYTSTSKDAVAGGVFVNGVYIMANSKPNTISATYRAVANISGGTFNVNTTTARAVYGVRTRGTTTITGGTFNVTPKTTMAYGILAEDGTTTVSGSATFTATATATAYGIFASGVTPDDKSGRPYNPVVTVNGGTFNVQTTSKTTAYGIYVTGATRPISSTEDKYYAGNYASAGNVTVNNGTFNITAKSTIAYGAVVAAPKTESGASGYAAATANPKCTINGGYFKLVGTGDVNAVNDLSTTDNFKVQGGYYSHDGHLDTYAVSPKHAVALQETDANYDPYFYKVAESYSVTFKNGSEVLQSGYQEKGKTPVYNGDAPTKASTSTTSYIFDGWSTSDGGAKVSPLPAVTSAGAIYYAHYAETTLKYTVTFDAKTNGGAEDAKVVYIEPSAGVGTLPTATKEGYTFNGWFTAATDGTKITTATVPTGDVAYYAQFTVNKYTLTWELGNGVVSAVGKYGSTSWPAKKATGTQSKAVSYGLTLTAPTVTRTGYTFHSWSPLVAATMPADAVTYTAQWTPNTNTAYTVKHYQQNVDGTYPTDPTETEALTGTTGESVTPAVKFYDGFTSPATVTKAIAADGKMVIEYQYQRLHYTITLDAATNGGTSEQQTIEVIHGATIGTVPPDAEKGCNDFTGWFTKANGGNKITSDFNIEYNLKTIYAQFSSELRKYTITYNAGANGTGTVASTIKTCGVNTNLSSSKFTRTGYTQIGWSLTDGGAQAYALGAAYTDNDALTLYPFWTVNTHKLAWNFDGGTTSSTTHTAAGNAVSYGTTITYPADNTMTKENFVFSGWSTDATTMPDANLTITALWTPAVASVTVDGATKYYETLQDAFDFAADKDTPTIKLLRDISGLTTQQKYTNTSNTTVTFDLNGHSIEGNANGFLYLTSDANSGTFNIVDNSAEQTGMVKNVMNYNGTRYCLYVHQGTVNLKGGTIYMQNTNTGTSVCAEAVVVRSSRKFNMTGGQIEVHSTRSAYAVYTSGTTKLSGGKIIANETSRGTSIAVYTITGTTTISGDIKCEATGTNNVYGAMVGGATPGTDGTLYRGTLVIDGGSFAVEATGASGEAYGAYCTANTRAIDYADNAAKAGNYADAGTLTIKNGEFTVKGATTYGVGTKAAVSTQKAKDADGLTTTYAKATATPKTTITGGKFDIQGTTKAAVNTTATAANLLIQGGWYSDATNLATKYTAPAKDCNYHVLPLEGENPYKYEVAEGYTVTFNANGHGTAPEAQVVKDGQKATEPTAPVADGYAFGGWYKEQACTNQWDFAIATVTATQTLYAKWTANEYTITFDSNGGSEVASIKQDFGSAVTAPANPTRTGYTFSGWLPEVPTTMPIDGATCVAQWSIDTYNISYTLDGGTVASANPATYNVETATITLNNPTKEGYTFLGWTGSNGTTPQTTVSIAKGSTGDKSYTANWVVNVAAVTVGSETTYYATIADAWEFVNDQTANTTIKLLQDVTTTESLVFTPAAAMTCTMDLNNHTLSGAVDKLIDIDLAKSTFVIDDSSEDKNGKILAEYSVNARLYGVFLSAGTLNLKAGHIHSKNPHTYSSATANKNSAATGLYVTKEQKFTMDGGTVESESQYNSIAIFASESGTTPITINGGRVYGHTTASTSGIGIYTYAKGLVVNGGTIIGHAWTTTAYGVYVRGGNATLNGGRIEATNDTTSSKGSTTAYGIYARGPITIPATSTVDVYAQARTNTAYAVYVYAGITGNTIAGGTFTAKAKTGKTAGGIYSAGNITVSGGTFTATTKTTGAYGIYSVRGTVTVNGDPTFNVTAGSTTAYGAYAYGTIGANGKGKYSGTINIHGGTFNVTSTKENAWGAYAALVSKTVKLVVPENADDTIAGTHYMPGILSITDGTFNVKAKTTGAYGIVVAGDKKESGAVGTTARYPKATVTGGKFKVESAGDANATAYATNTSASATYLKVEGGKYNTKRTNASATSNIEDKYTAPTKSCNYHVLPLTGEDPYQFEVAEAYKVYWDATTNGGTCEVPYTIVKKGSTIGSAISPLPQATKPNHSFDGWFTTYTTGGTQAAEGSIINFQLTFYARFSPLDFGAYIDIVDWISDGKIVINTNGMTVANTSAADPSAWQIVVNGTTYTKSDRLPDRTLKLDVASLNLKAGNKVVIETKDLNTGTVDSHHEYTVPQIFDANATLSGTNAESIIYVHNGTLTVNSNLTVDKIYVCPGAELKINSGKKLTVGTLVMRTETTVNQYYNPPVLTDNGTLNVTSMYYTRIVRDRSQAFQLGFPFSVNLSGTKYSNGKTATFLKDYSIMYYDAQSRADNGLQGGEIRNWKALPSGTTTLQANQGYQLLSTSKFYTEYYFPVTYSKVPNGAQVSVTAYSGKAGAGDQGWNYITLPYVHRYTTSVNPENPLLVSELTEDNNTFWQHVVTDLLPVSPFYYQCSESGNLTFTEGNLQKQKPAQESARPLTQWLQLLYGKAESASFDEMNIFLHPDKFTAGYETGFDMQKMSLESTRPLLYSPMACGNLAMVAVPDTMAEQSTIPVTVFAPQKQEMSFSLGSFDYTDRLSHVWLIDKELGTQTDLLFADYEYMAEQGTTAGRFYVRAEFRKIDIPTDIETDGTTDDKDKLEIEVKGLDINISGLKQGEYVRLYDAVGKLVREQKADENGTAIVTASKTGVYLLQTDKLLKKVTIVAL